MGRLKIQTSFLMEPFIIVDIFYYFQAFYYLIFMKIVLGFAFYFLLITMALTLGLVIFFIRPLRKLLIKYNVLTDNMVFAAIKYFAFVIIGLIFIQSVYDFTVINRHINQQHMDLGGIQLQKMNLMSAGSHGHSLQGAMETLREYRKYYESQRNMMLTASAFFAYFIFNRMLATLIKLAGIQHDIEHPNQVKPKAQPQHKSQAPKQQTQQGHAKVQ